MARADDSEFKAFTSGLSAAYQRVGGGKIALDTNRLRALVREHKAGAFRFVELHCEMAQSQPGYLQPALIVATAYDAEFGGSELIQMVNDRARELGPLAAEEISQIQVTLPPEDSRGEGRGTTGTTMQHPGALGSAPGSQETDPVTLFEGLMQARIGLKVIAAWVDQVRPSYERPDFAQIRDQSAITDLSWYDWDDEQRTLMIVLKQVSQVTERIEEQEPEKAALYAQAVFLACPLLARDEAAGKFAARAGFVLSDTGHILLAADALSYSVAALDRWGGDPSLTFTAASQLCRVLLNAREFDRAVSAGQALAERATAMKLRGYQAIALHALGSANAELGRPEGLDQLRDAVRLRRLMSEQEAAEQEVAPLASYLGAYGTKARDAGQLETAQEAFLEMADVTDELGDQEMHAYALSELGETFMVAGDPAAAARYLFQAAHAGERYGVSDGPARWRALAVMLQQSQQDPPDEAGEPLAPVPDHLRVPQLIKEGQYGAALALARQLLSAAEASKNTPAVLEALNNIGICLLNLDGYEESVRSFQRGIQLADGLGHNRASLDIRQNLAEAYIGQQKYQEALRVLLTSIAYALQLWDANVTTGLREQIVASTVSLYERTALIATLGQQFDTALAVAELARARNTRQWMLLESLVQGANLSRGDRLVAQAAIKDLLAIEVEADVRFLTGAVPLGEWRRLAQRRSQTRHAVEAALPEPGGIAAFSTDPHIYRTAESALAETAGPGTAILSLFSLPDHLSWILAHNDGEQITITGNLIDWPREEREHAAKQWRNAQQEALIGHGDLPAELDQLIAEFQERLLTPLVAAVDSTGARRLCVLPNAELALLPYWPLVDGCPAVESLAIAPSLGILQLCINRSRPSRGQTVIIPDRTHSLDLSPLELALVRKARHDHQVHEPSSVKAFHNVAAGCTLLHVTGHGIFNTRNPYYSGFLISRGENARGIFTQYLPAPGSAPVNGPTRWAVRLFTVAECLAELSLPQCRLAVLSACESGVPRMHAGGELTGLPNALLVSGAKSVIATLWPTDEGAAAALLHYFYEVWDGGSGHETSVAQALTAARKKLWVRLFWGDAV